MRPVLSVLVPSVHSRFDTFAQRLQGQLYTQRESLDDPRKVEVIVLTDTKSMTVGAKRNALIGLASGEYVVFVDDDDRLEDDYLSTLVDVVETHRPDVVTFLVSVSLNGAPAKLCRYSSGFAADRNTSSGYERLPNHLMPVRRELAEAVGFPDVSVGEDSAYAKNLHEAIQTEFPINRVLYHYDFDTESTEAQKRPVDADVVILSKASDAGLQEMTQAAVDSCIRGARPHRVNVTVVEQIPGVTYPGAKVLHLPGEFNYNAFANRGAARGDAPNIVIANNDLNFADGWLTHLLAPKHPVVSPANPGDGRQVGVIQNQSGAVNGRHFCGWCFMITRDLWESIGGLDEDFPFWCADDSVIEQVLAAGVRPMLVPKSKVRHLRSVTTRTSPVAEDMTWGAVHRFNVKYGRMKFAGDPRFEAWRLAHEVSEAPPSESVEPASQ